MYVLCKSLRHFTSTYVCYSVKGKAIIDLTILVQVLSYGVHDQTKKVRVLMHEQSHCQITLNEVPSARQQESRIQPHTICFSLYFGLEIKLTASMCPTSTL